jgi:hypothetical protein
MVKEDERVFELGLAMAGAISAGAYSAGVLDFLVQALDEWEKQRFLPQDGDPVDAPQQKNPAVPDHRVVLKVISGASAGAVTGALGVIALARGLQPTPYAAHSPGKQRHRCVLPLLYSTWVERPRMVGGAMDFLSDQDLKGDDAAGQARPGVVRSVLNSNLLDDIVSDALAPVPDRPAPPVSYVAREFHVYMTVSNLRGVPYELKLTGGSYAMMAHGDRVHYVVDGVGTWPGASPWASADPGVPISVSWLFDGGPQGAVWRAYGTAALASSAFPVGLAARAVDADLASYMSRRTPLDHAGILPSPAFPAGWVAQKTPRNFHFLNVDGGLINNEPLEYARFTLMDDPPNANKRKGREADRAVLMVDPFPEPPTFLADDRPPPDLVSVLKALLPALKNQARFKPSELLFAASDDVYSRFMIAPHRTTGGRKGRDSEREAKFPMASALLGGFGGFLDEKFRAHDYQLGRRNCQRFLMRRFALPLENGIVGGWPEEASLHSAFSVAAGTGTERVLVPLVGSAADEVELPPWPRMSRADFDEFQRRLEQRLDAVVPVLIRSQTSSRTLRLALRAASGVGKGRVLSYLRDAVLADLIRRDQIEGWDLPPGLIEQSCGDGFRRVLAELANPTYDLRTARGIAATTDLDLPVVEEVIRVCTGADGKPYEIWQSGLRRRGGEPLYCLASRKPSWFWRQWGTRSVGEWLSTASVD